MPWDADFWGGVLGTAKDGLTGLFEDMGFGAPSTPSTPQDWGWLQPKQETPSWGWLGSGVASPTRPNPFKQILQQQKPQAQAQAVAPTGPMYGGQFSYETPLALDPGTEALVQMAREVAKATGVDEEVFIRQINQESRFNPRAVSGAGAKGLGQLMDPTARELGIGDPFDPRANLQGSARYLKQHLDKYKGDYTKALAAYNMGAGALDAAGGTPYGEGAIYVNRIMAGAKRREVGTSAPGAPAGGIKPLKGLTDYQYGQESLATGAADYICGPIAAEAFVEATGRDMTLQEALNAARDLGVIDAKNGMHGIESTARLIRHLGAKATVGAVDTRQMVAELAAGRPVIVDTNAGSRGHYFVAEDYDPQTGRFDFGNSARSLKASKGNTWYTLQEIATLGFGSVAGAIYAR
jgi:hypothetical protein